MPNQYLQPWHGTKSTSIITPFTAIRDVVAIIFGFVCGILGIAACVKGAAPLTAIICVACSPAIIYYAIKICICDILDGITEDGFDADKHRPLFSMDLMNMEDGQICDQKSIDVYIGRVAKPTPKLLGPGSSE